MRVACGVRRVTCVRRACGMFRRDAKDSTRRAVNVYDDGGRTGDGRADGGGDDDDGDDDMRAPDRQGRVGGFHVAVPSLQESPSLREAARLTMTFGGDGRRRRTGAADGVVVRERRSGEGGGGEGLRALTVGTTGFEVWKVYKIFLRR